MKNETKDAKYWKKEEVLCRACRTRRYRTYVGKMWENRRKHEELCVSTEREKENNGKIEKTNWVREQLKKEREAWRKLKGEEREKKRENRKGRKVRKEWETNLKQE